MREGTALFKIRTPMASHEGPPTRLQWARYPPFSLGIVQLVQGLLKRHPLPTFVVSSNPLQIRPDKIPFIALA
jgi:hypothetical protein